MEKYKPLYLLLGMTTVSWFGSGILIQVIWGDTGRGTIGDMFGAINALFSGLAFAGIIYTIMMQRKELALQREELKLQRDEVAKSTQELAGQREQMEFQRFETTFFNLVKVYGDVVSEISIGTARGREVFIKVMNNLHQNNNDFEFVFKGFHYLLNHYFNTATTIVEYVHKHKVLIESDKQQYIKFFRSQISEYELILIYCFTNRNIELLSLFEYYKFFEELNDTVKTTYKIS
ncbi:putative phage abortive infection protein [Paenibacillus sp. CF384]|uniref:putative phage abortive infection protein n=1 Tax=Paenibacillus sp. CF384 TaxID=1884382 RepID=UPI00089B1AFE|nr:putative phage abortive infection protein [Paenibacillus sp. CF384]SDX81652.1 Putative phage abortive infection protein [Paenibacillus sp. CF384]